MVLNFKEHENEKEYLKTARLILRKFHENDMEALYLLLKDEEVNTFLPWFPMQSLEETECFYEKNMMNQPYFFAICFLENNIPIGYIKVDTDDSYDFGFALQKQFWHQGIVSEASKAVVEV